MTGEVVYLFAFDVAAEILPAKIRPLLGRTPELLDIRRDHTSPKDVPYQPLAVEPGVLFSSGNSPVRVQVRVYEVGVVSVLLRLAFEKEKLADLTPLHRAVLSDGRSFGAAANEICKQVTVELKDAVVRPAIATEPEAYTVFCLTNLDEEREVGVWLGQHQADVAGLLSDMPSHRLSKAQISETLRQQQSFETTDLVVVDWDAALVIDLDGYVDDVLHVLELANLQLEEFRVMDRVLDKQLNATYALIEERTGFQIGGTTNHLRQLRSLSVDLTKLADEVHHITKFLGDWYLARVYMCARDRFHLEQWRSSVGQRLDQLNGLYSVVRAEVAERRMLWLEIIIVVFFAIDLLAIIFIK